MWATNNSVKIQSKIDDTIWSHGDKIHVDEEFQKHFIIKEIKSKYSTSKIITYVTIISSDEIARIKWRPNVRDYIFNNNIWLKEDKYQTQITTTPGYFTGLNPRVTWKDDFMNDLNVAMEEIEIDDKKSSARLEKV